MNPLKPSVADRRMTPCSVGRLGGERPHRPLDALGGGERLLAERREHPARGAACEHPPAERLLEGVDAPGDRRVVEAEPCRGGRVPAVAGDREEHEEVVGIGRRAEGRSSSTYLHIRTSTVRFSPLAVRIPADILRR